jgi:thermitase
MIMFATPPASAAAGGDFPAGSLAPGHPALHSEQRLADGTVESLVPPTSRVAANELLVRFRPHVKERLQSRAGLTKLGFLPDLSVELVRVDPADRNQLISHLKSEHSVDSVQPDTVESTLALECQPNTCSIPDDPGFAYQWYLENAPGVVQPPGSGAPVYGADVDAPLAWSKTLGSEAVTIAIIDSGIDPTHPDLAAKIVAAANFTESTSASDMSGHGTHVAGITAASFDNAIGIAGMAPKARLMNVKVLALDANGQTTGSCAGVADGIVWAANHGANVLNLSLGSTGPCEAMALAVEYATSHGALVVAAAGNEGSTSRFYPAAYPDVLSVAATDNRDQLAPFSNRGASWVDVAAPGAGIVSTLPTYDNATGVLGYGYLSGTSMAAPVVSGIAALIWPLMPTGPINLDVQNRIIASAEPIIGTGTDWRYGLVDACRAVTGTAASCSGQPSVTVPGNPPPAPAPLAPAPPAVAAPAPAPPQLAQPAPVGPPPAASPNAAPGTYAGSLGRRGGPLRLVVGERGDAMIRIQATVSVSCRRGAALRVRVVGLSTTDYGKIEPSGKFEFRIRKSRATLRKQEFQISGRFNVATSRSNGTLRVTGRDRRNRPCDSRSISWSAPPAP